MTTLTSVCKILAIAMLIANLIVLAIGGKKAVLRLQRERAITGLFRGHMNNVETSPHEIKAEIARAHGKDCVGCRRYGADVMITFLVPAEAERSRFRDAFMMREAAIQLRDDLIGLLGPGPDPRQADQSKVISLFFGKRA